MTRFFPPIFLLPQSLLMVWANGPLTLDMAVIVTTVLEGILYDESKQNLFGA